MTYTDFGPLNINQQQANEIAQRGYGVVNTGPGDDRLLVGFYRKSVLNAHKSRDEGRRIYEDHDFVKIQHPGETLNVVDRPINDSDKFRWPRQWAMFQAGKEQKPDGIPITLLFPDKPSITDTLMGYNIHTIEQLANLSANGIQTVGMGAQEWVNKAQTYMKQAEKGIDFHRFEQERAEKDRQIATLQRQVNELSSQLNRVMKHVEPPQDVQTAQINNRGPERFNPPASVSFSNEIRQPDLSGEVKRRGRPPGSRNRPKEQNDG